MRISRIAEKREGFSTLIILLVILSVAIVGFVCFRVYESKNSETTDNRLAKNSEGCGVGMDNVSTNPDVNNNEYINKTGVDKDYKFSISLPKDWGMDLLFTQQVEGREFTKGNVGPIIHTDPNLPCAGNKSREEVDFRYKIVTSTQDVSNDIIATKISPSIKPEVTNKFMTINGLDAAQRVYKWDYEGLNKQKYTGEVKMYIYQANDRYYYIVLQAEPNMGTDDAQFDRIAQSFKLI